MSAHCSKMTSRTVFSRTIIISIRRDAVRSLRQQSVAVPSVHAAAAAAVTWTYDTRQYAQHLHDLASARLIDRPTDRRTDLLSVAGCSIVLTR